MENKNKINVYTCTSCKHPIVTINLDEGVTPFMIGCPRKECALGKFTDARSSFYNVDQRIIPVYGWYRKKEADPGGLDHHNNGGLFLRKLTKDEFLTIAVEQYDKYPETDQ